MSLSDAEPMAKTLRVAIIGYGLAGAVRRFCQRQMTSGVILPLMTWLW